MTKEYIPTIALDFDGVLNTYTGWKGENELYEPRPGTRQFLEKLSKKYSVKIYSTRDASKIKRWLYNHNLDQYIDEVTNTKPLAIAYVDDRAIRFNGDYNEIMDKIEEETHWEKKR